MPVRIQKQRILIADDHLIFRQALRALLSSEESLELTGEAADGLEVVHLALKATRYDPFGHMYASGKWQVLASK